MNTQSKVHYCSGRIYATILFGLVFGFLLCTSSFAIVSDTQSFFLIPESSVPADGASSSTVSIYIKDVAGGPISGKIVSITTFRGNFSDSISQPGLTNSNGQCTGTISSIYGGWDTITVICEGKNIGSPFQWIQTTQEDFTSGETQTNIDTTTNPGSIKIFYQFWNSDIPNNDFEDSLNSWTVYPDPNFLPGVTAVQSTYTKYSGSNSVRIHFEDNAYCSVQSFIVYIIDSQDQQHPIMSLTPGQDWYRESFSTSSYEGQNVKLKFYAMLNKPVGGSGAASIISDTFKCSGGEISFYQRKYISSNNADSQSAFIDFIKGGRWEEIAPDSATYISKSYDLGIDTFSYSTFGVNYATNGQTISFDVRTADTKNGLSSATWYPATNNGPIDAPRKKWIQWKCQMHTGGIDTSPLLDTVTINYLAPKSIYFAPVLRITNISASPNPFSPNSDGRKDTTTISYTLIDNNPSDTVWIRIYKPPNPAVVRTRLNGEVQNVGAHTIEWDGKKDDLSFVDNGIYTCEITSRDSYGNEVVNTFSITVDLIKPVPKITAVNLGKLQVGLTFSADESIESYQILRSSGDTNSFQIIGSTATGDFLDTSALGDNQNYYYKIIASDLAGNTQTSNIIFARMTQDGGILKNTGDLALTNVIIKCKDDANAFVTVPETKTFGDTVELVKIKLAKKSEAELKSGGKILPVDKKVVGSYEIQGFEVDAGGQELGEIKTLKTGKLVNLTLRYENCPPDKTGTLAIYEWSGTQWVKRGGTINTGNQTLSLDVSHFSTYAIMYQTAQSFTGAKPNPFSPNNDGINDIVQINFENSENKEAKLSIFDLPGRLVWSKSYPAGQISVTWDGKDFTGRVVEGGAYIYQVEIGTRVVNGVAVVAK